MVKHQLVYPKLIRQYMHQNCIFILLLKILGKIQEPYMYSVSTGQCEHVTIKRMAPVEGRAQIQWP